MFDAKPEDREQIALYIVSIDTDHKQGPDGVIEAVDFITFNKKGASNYQMIKSVHRLQKDEPQLWEHFKPVYDKWKESNTIATEGHPIEAWPAITKGQIKACKGLGLRSVEDIAGATDAIREKFGMGFLDLQAQAKLFVESKEATATAHEIAELRKQNEMLNEAVKEAREAIAALRAEQGKRPVGRPRKDAAEAA